MQSHILLNMITGDKKIWKLSTYRISLKEVFMNQFLGVPANIPDINDHHFTSAIGAF